MYNCMREVPRQRSRAESIHTQLQLEVTSHLPRKRFGHEERFSLEPWLILVGQVGAAESYCSAVNSEEPTGRASNLILLEFYGGFLIYTPSIINSISSPHPISGELRGAGAENSKLLILAGLSDKISSHSGATQSRLIRNKDAPSMPVTYEFIKVLGALCQGWGKKPNVYFVL